MDTGCPSVLKTGRKSNSDCACTKLRGRVTAPNGVPVTKARVTKSPVMGNYHAGSGVAAGWATAPPTITQPTALRARKSAVPRAFSWSYGEGDFHAPAARVAPRPLATIRCQD